MVNVENGWITVLDGDGCYRDKCLLIRSLEAEYGQPVTIPLAFLFASDGSIAEKDSRPNIPVPDEAAKKGCIKDWVDGGRFLFHACRNALVESKTAIAEELLKEGLIEKDRPTESQQTNQKPQKEAKRTYRRSNQRLTPEKWYNDHGHPGRYRVKLPKFRWRLKGPDGKFESKETFVENLEIEFERFIGDNDEIRLEIFDFSPEHKIFLERAFCFKKGGHEDNPKERKVFAMFDRVLNMDYDNKFPKK